uniref:Uncharacterized protein n=1 Tax=Solanum tuberosum TaxID=4113 RepID=M1DR28_SOLTU
MRKKKEKQGNRQVRQVQLVDFVEGDPYRILFKLKLCLAFQLAYSYIQCTNASWPASYYDADADLRFNSVVMTDLRFAKEINGGRLFWICYDL